MEITLLVAAFVFLILGGYGAFFLPKNRSEVEARHRARPPVPKVATTWAWGRRPAVRPNLPDSGVWPAAPSFSEVEQLRAQVDQLRSEILALSSGERQHRSRSRKTPALVAD